MNDNFIGRPLGDAAQQVAEQNELRRRYDYLFATERDRLTQQVETLASENRDLREQVRSLTSGVARLEHDLGKVIRKSKPYNRVVFDIKATITGDASSVLDTMIEMYGRALGGSIRLTHGDADGNSLHAWVEYDVCGGHPADMRRMLARVLRHVGTEVVADPVITVIDRKSLSADGTPT